MKDLTIYIAIVTIAIFASCLNVGAEDKIQKEIDYAYKFLKKVVPGDHTDILNATPELKNLGKVSYSTFASISLYNFKFQMPWTDIKQLSVTDETAIILFNSQVLVAISPPMILPDLFADFHGALEKNLSDNEMEKVGDRAVFHTLLH